MTTSLRHAVCTLVTCAPLMAQAAPGDWVEDWRFGVELGAEFPIAVGGGVMVETPFRLRLNISLGALPGPYLDAINGISVASNWYDELTADLIAAALKNSLIWRTRLGWRPWEQHGFYFGAGYTLATLGGGLSGAEVLTAVTDKTIEGGDSVNRSFSVNSTVHFADVEVGWEWVLEKGFWIRTGLGGVFTVGSKTQITPDWTPPPRVQPSVDALATAGEAYLDDIYGRYVHTATVTVAVGWMF